MRKTRILIAAAVVLAIVSIFVFGGSSSGSTNSVIIDTQKGQFTVDIMTSGALEAKNSVKISGPTGLRNYRIWNVNIQDIIEEGTFVKKGQYVARLDPSEVTGKIKDSQLEVDRKQSQFTQTKLDTALTLRQARDQLINLEYDVREKKLVLDQSQFEPPATIQKAEIELEKARRALKQEKENYQIKKQQSVAQMEEATAELTKEKNELNGLLALSQQFTILAPEDGMLIYKKNYDGKPLKEGSQIGAWDPVVATLPDLSQMMSKTFVNEVDIRKVKSGQTVEIGFDAFPDKSLKGKVVKVANVGEQQPNSDAKVFEVMIEVFGTDPLLKPGMTTSNRIITKTVEDGLFIPLECLHSQNDSITYVFKKSGVSTVKQEVILGEANAENVLILGGLTEGDRLSLSTVGGMDDSEINLLPELDGKRLKSSEPKQEQISRTPRKPRRKPNS